MTKRVGTYLGVQGVEVSWRAAAGNPWVSYYEILKDESVIAKAATGTFLFDIVDRPMLSANARYCVVTVDGEGQRSAPAVADILPR